MKNMKEKWEKLHTLPRFRPRYPNIDVVRFLFNGFCNDREKRKNLKILDIGCGGGRHLKLFAEQAFDVYGCDFSAEGIEQTKKMLNENSLTAKLKLGNMSRIPYKDNFFAGAVSFGVYYYSTKDEMKKSISELYRVLKKDGKALILIKTKDDFRKKLGKKIEKNTVIMETDFTNEKDMILHFLTKNEIIKYYSMFKKINIEKIEYTINNMKYKNSDWLITVEK